MVQAGRRAVYEPEALAFEKPTPTNETEYARKVRMFEHCWEITLRGSMLRRLPPLYLVSMRLAPRPPLRERGAPPRAPRDERRSSCRRAGRTCSRSSRSSVLAAAFAARVPIARYYVYVTWATVQALWNYLRRGVPATWEAAEGTR